jgi:ribonuclease G
VNKELVIHSTTDEVVIALLEEKKLVELHKEKTDNDFAVGDLYLGRVKKIVPSLNAAFVDVGYTKDAFLHYLDLGPQLKSFKKFTKGVQSGKFATSALDKFEKEEDINKDGKIDDVISANQNILIQVAKEPISTKGPRVSCEISLAGRFLVLVPFSDKVTCSQKIRNREERNRLKTLIRSIKPKNFGVIIRTVAQNKKVVELDADLRNLAEKWEKLFGNLKKAKQNDRVLGEINRSNALIRDLLNPSFNNIHVENEELHDEIKSYLTSIAPDRLDILKHFKSRLPIFEHFGIERQIKSGFGRNVTMSSGAYLIIEHTEALHVVDVNSGNTGKGITNQEENALKVNLESADEIARQLRLRDMGGIIVVDFIDMKKAESKKALVDRLKTNMNSDRAKHQILPPSKFGLIQITRQRVRPEMDIKTTEIIPTSTGDKEVQATILIIDDIEQRVNMMVTKHPKKKLILHAHPFVSAYLKQGFWSYQRKWFSNHKKWVSIIERNNYPLMKYRFFDDKKNVLVQ